MNLGIGNWMLDTGYSIFDAGWTMQDARCKMQDGRCRIIRMNGKHKNFTFVFLCVFAPLRETFLVRLNDLCKSSRGGQVCVTCPLVPRSGTALRHLRQAGLRMGLKGP